jgi:hypothetical protein
MYPAELIHQSAGGLSKGEGLRVRLPLRALLSNQLVFQRKLCVPWSSGAEWTPVWAAGQGAEGSPREAEW